MPKDYSGDYEWETCRIAYSRAQLDYPEGLGMRRVIQMKIRCVGYKPLWQVSPDQFKKLIQRLRDEYPKVKRQREN